MQTWNSQPTNAVNCSSWSSVYPRPAVFAQFLMSKLYIDYYQYHADSTRTSSY